MTFGTSALMLKRRKEELEPYKLFASDPAFKAAWQQSVERFVQNNPQGRTPDQGRTA
jgi:type I restriction enzyme R subunit